MKDDPLLQSLRKARQARLSRDPADQGGETASSGKAREDSLPTERFDFANLDVHKKLRMHRAAADMLGIRNPFFRPQETLSASMTRFEDRDCINFANYNYLGLNHHPKVRQAAVAACDRHGISAGASRLVGGEHPYHAELEKGLANAIGVEDCIVMVSGHATNVTTIGTLMGDEDLILVDSLIHNSVSEGARLSGAHRIVFPHNDWAWVDNRLSRIRRKYRNVLIVVEGLYSMDGDSPDLARFVDVKSRHDAWLMVDEAHSLGVLGNTGCGIAEATGVDPRDVEIWMGTLSKTLASCGGYVAGSGALTEILRFQAPGFVYSVGLPAPSAEAACMALTLMLEEPERVARLEANGQMFRRVARDAGLDTGLSEGHAVCPVIIGDSLRAVSVSADLYEAGVYALPIIAPAVEDKQARVRFFLTSEHTEDQIRTAVAATARAVEARRDEDLLGQLGNT